MNRMSLATKYSLTTDMPRKGVAKAYRQNWEGGRDPWKQGYRQRKERRMTQT
jgi:hypothetical protein